MNIWQEMIEVGKFPTGSDHCSLFHNTPTTVYYYVTRVHSHFKAAKKRVTLQGKKSDTVLKKSQIRVKIITNTVF